jgi:formylglycine-generating enzyme required for sulfatase activity
MPLQRLLGLGLLIAITMNCSGSSSSKGDKTESGTGGSEQQETAGHAGKETEATSARHATSSGGHLGRGGTSNQGGTTVGGTPGTTAPGGTSGIGDTTTTLTLITCPVAPGPMMVSLPRGYCIDSTEVTRDQYAAWLATNPALPPSEDVSCGWKSKGSYAPDASCLEYASVCKGTTCGNHPQVCVDWCDASAYCAGVGKRLCGKIGGGSLSYDAPDNVALGQWFNACAFGSGLNTYPYGVNYSKDACNGYDYWGSNSTFATVPVGSLPRCQAPIDSPYRGVFDLSGNVKEWEDCCSGSGQTATCRVRGGSSTNIRWDMTCEFGSNLSRDAPSFDTGFRCCTLN